MTLEQLLKDKNYSHRINDGRITVTHKDDIFLSSLLTLPEGVRFNNQGDVYLTALSKLPEGVQFNNQGEVFLNSLTTLPEDVQFNNAGWVDLRSLTTLPEGVQFNNRVEVFLCSLTTLPEGIQFNNQGSVDLRSLTTLSKSVQFNNKGYILLWSLTTLPEGVQFNNQGDVDSQSLTTLSEGVQFNNRGYVNLESLTTLPDGIQFNNGGKVDLCSLTTLPEGMQFNNQGYVDLRSLTPEKQFYRGKEITLRTIDGYTMLIESEKTIKGITIYKARYFGGGEIENLEKCYVAKVGRHWAHGKTLKEAIEDATEKAVKKQTIIELEIKIRRIVDARQKLEAAFKPAIEAGCIDILIEQRDAAVLMLARTNRELDAKVKQMHDLAEALERILAWKGGYEEEEPESIAVNALASLKGGNP